MHENGGALHNCDMNNVGASRAGQTAQKRIPTQSCVLFLCLKTGTVAFLSFETFFTQNFKC